jgi:5-methylthioadenosine/S-adenosylhomocysteine deaminase
MATTLIRGATVLTMDDELGTLPHGDVLIDGDRIAAVGEGLASPGADVIDATDGIVLPGFVDGHRHMMGSMLRGVAVNVQSYEDFFQQVVIGYGGNYSVEDTYACVRLGAVESIDSGITTLHAWEHNLITPAHADASFRAMYESGLRVRFSYGPPNDTMMINLEDVLRMRDEVFTRHEDGRYMTADGRAHLGIATRGVEYSRPEIWEKEIAFAREHRLPITAHVMARNITECMERDVLGPDILSVHANDATPEEIAYLAGCGTPVCVAPVGLARTGIGYSPIVEMMAAGIPLTLSVDSIAGNDTADFFAVMKFGVLIERMRFKDKLAYRPEQALRHATAEGAMAVGLGQVTGSLTPGKKADLIMLRGGDINMAPLNNTLAQVVMCGQPRNVDTVFIDGICRKRDGQLVGVDVEECIQAARAAVRRVGERYGSPVS